MSEIRDAVQAEPLFDCHEHQRGFTATENAKGDVDYQAFLGYAMADMNTAAAGKAPDTSTPGAFFATWQYVRTTGYGLATEMGCRHLLGIDFTAENAEAITQALRDFVRDKTGRRIHEELYAEANVCGAVCDECWQSPTKLDFFTGAEHLDCFGHALRYDKAIDIISREQVGELEGIMDCSLQRLGDLDRALDEYAEKARQAGKLVAFKTGLAYHKGLRFENSSHAAAERVFQEIMQRRQVDPQPLQDYLFHRFVQRAHDFALPVQVHTGYLSGNYCSCTQGDPTPLIPILQRYRDVKFDLFHAGWPHTEVMGAIDKTFPNVYVDLCWAWSMSPATIERALGEWLSSVPHNKIFAFGADVGDPYPMLGYAMQARNGIARVLESKIDSGEYDLSTARRVAGRIMSENAKELYRMG